MNKILVVVLLMSGCANFNPELAEPAKNASKYEHAKVDCKEEAQQRFDKAINNNQRRDAGFAVFGAIGGLVNMATAPVGDEDKTMPEMQRECLTKRGYRLK